MYVWRKCAHVCMEEMCPCMSGFVVGSWGTHLSLTGVNECMCHAERANIVNIATAATTDIRVDDQRNFGLNHSQADQ